MSHFDIPAITKQYILKSLEISIALLLIINRILKEKQNTNEKERIEIHYACCCWVASNSTYLNVS